MEIQEIREELQDRFGPIPESTEALFLETEIKCLAQEAGFDQVATSRQELLCRYVRRSSNEGVRHVRKVGKLPILIETRPLLKLKEIIRFLKLHLHGNS